MKATEIVLSQTPTGRGVYLLAATNGRYPQIIGTMEQTPHGYLVHGKRKPIADRDEAVHALIGHRVRMALKQAAEFQLMLDLPVKEIQRTDPSLKDSEPT